ncbi:MAG: BLUF domain-containing protein [Pacificimonas sp.]
MYVSKAALTFDEAALIEIYRTAERLNVADEITGVLLFNGREFVQLIEGDTTAVRQTMSRIARDRRHGDVDILLDRPISTRRFPNWSMAYRDLRVNKEDPFVRAVQTKVATAPPAARAVFEDFARAA